MTEIGKKRPLDQIETVEETAKKKLKPSFTFEPSKTFAGASKNFTPWLTKETENFSFGNKSDSVFSFGKSSDSTNFLKPAANPFGTFAKEKKQVEIKEKKRRTSFKRRSGSSGSGEIC